MSEKRIKPQEGAQRRFLESEADIAIYGGSAGGGKTFALILESLRHLSNSKFSGVIFRRTMVQIKSAGGLWSEASGIYSMLGAKLNETELKSVFLSGASVKFAHLEHEKTKYDWQGAQMPFIGFDELTHFSEATFFYMLSRLRSMSGIAGYVRATCNPDADSWLRRFLAYWIDDLTGLPIPERSGVLRWFIRINDALVWDDSRQALIDQYGEGCEPKSVTFIPASIYDNKILMQKDPSYLSNLKALARVEREQLLEGNWNIRPASGLYFKRDMFEVIDIAPADLQCVRFWDRAATEPTAENPKPDFSVGMKSGRHRETGILYLMHMARAQISAWKVEAMIKNLASQDGRDCTVGLFRDPASAGKAEAEYMVRQLIGFSVHVIPATSNKIVMATPASSQAEQGNIKVVRGNWNEDFFKEVENFPEGGNDDIVDTLSGAVAFFGSEVHGSFGGQNITQRDATEKRREHFISKVNQRIKVTNY